MYYLQGMTACWPSAPRSSWSGSCICWLNQTFEGPAQGSHLLHRWERPHGAHASSSADGKPLSLGSGVASDHAPFSPLHLWPWDSHQRAHAMLKVSLGVEEAVCLPGSHRPPAVLVLLVEGCFVRLPEVLLLCLGLEPFHGQSCYLPKWQWGRHLGGMRGESPRGVASSLRLEAPWDRVACQH